MTASKPITVVSLTLTLALAACGDGNAINFSVDGARTLSSLDPSELDAICRDMSQVVTYFSQGDICLVSGLAMRDLVGKGDPAYCKSFYNQCMSQPLPPLEYDCDMKGSEGLPGCQATVQELEDCANDRVRALRSALPSLTCSTVKDSWIHLDNPASCQAIEARCPGIDLD